MTVAQKIIPIQTIKSWSHSRAVDFEKCAFGAKLKYINKIPEPERPLPPGKLEHANDRGTRVHEAIEAYTRGLTDAVPREAWSFRVEIEALRKLFKAGQAGFEGNWGYDRAWEVAAWETAWLRMKLDAIVFLSPQEAVVIDYKTGKIFGNEVKHGEQTMLYQLASFLRYPELEVVHTELWYLDHDQLNGKTFTRNQGLRFKKAWDMRGTAITSAIAFPPNPNHWSCRYCPYGKPENGFATGTGHCPVGRKS